MMICDCNNDDDDDVNDDCDHDDDGDYGPLPDESVPLPDEVAYQRACLYHMREGLCYWCFWNGGRNYLTILGSHVRPENLPYGPFI